MFIPRLPTLVFAACVATFLAPRSASAAEAPLWSLDTGLTLLVAPVVQAAAVTPLWAVQASTLPSAAEVATASETKHSWKPRMLEELSPRQLLTSIANRLRDIRYRRGGRDPESGFDCSGFVRYVFQHGLNADLPHSSAAQFHVGRKIDRKELRSGDLVFFRIAGKSISHVGIYLDDGRFIHAPSSGKRVSVSSLSEPYWAKRYAGAKRPDVLVAHDDTLPQTHDRHG